MSVLAAAKATLTRWKSEPASVSSSPTNVAAAMVQAIRKSAIRMGPAIAETRIEVILTGVVQTAPSSRWAAAVTAVADFGRSRSR